MNNYLIFPVGPSNKSISTSYLPVHFFIIRNIALNATSIGPSGPSIVGLATPKTPKPQFASQLPTKGFKFL